MYLLRAKWYSRIFHYGTHISFTADHARDCFLTQIDLLILSKVCFTDERLGLKILKMYQVFSTQLYLFRNLISGDANNKCKRKQNFYEVPTYSLWLSPICVNWSVLLILIKLLALNPLRAFMVGLMATYLNKYFRAWSTWTLFLLFSVSHITRYKTASSRRRPATTRITY